MECKTKKDWELLKEFDAGYECIQVDVYPYGSDDPLKVNIFVMEGFESENKAADRNTTTKALCSSHCDRHETLWSP
jgi:hypothetical protein